MMSELPMGTNLEYSAIVQANEDEVEIRLNDLLLFLMAKWRSICILIVAFAVILGGYKYWDNWRNADKDGTAVVDQFRKDAKRSGNYTQDDLEALDRAAKNIATYYEQIQTQRVYNAKSILQTINWTNVSSRESFYRVTLRGKAKYSDLLVLAESFKSRLASDELYSKIAKEMGTEADFVKELVDVQYSIPQLNESSTAFISAAAGENETSDENAAGTLINYNTFILNVQSKGPDLDFCQKIQDYAQTLINTNSSDLSEQIGENTVAYIQTVSNISRDEEIRDAQLNNAIEIEDGYYSLIDAAKEKLTKDEVNYVDALAILYEEENGSRQKTEKENKSYLSKRYIAYGMIGGMALGLIFWAVLYVFGGAVSNPWEMEDNYRLKTILYAGSEKRLKGFDALFYKWRFHSGLVVKDTDFIEVMKAEILTEAQEKKIRKVVLTGTSLTESDKKLISRLEEDLKSAGIETAVGSMIMYSPELIVSSANADAAVILERLGVSSKGLIREEVKYMKDHRIPILTAAMAVS